MSARVLPLLDELAAELLAQQREIRFRLSGRCMEPGLQEGSMVCAQSAELRRPRVGEVVLVRVGGNLKVHRLLGIWGDRIQTRPDVGAWDPLLRTSDILGVVEGPRPPLLGRYWARRAKAFALLRGWISHG